MFLSTHYPLPKTRAHKPGPPEKHHSMEMKDNILGAIFLWGCKFFPMAGGFKWEFRRKKYKTGVYEKPLNFE